MGGGEGEGWESLRFKAGFLLMLMCWILCACFLPPRAMINQQFTHMLLSLACCQATCLPACVQGEAVPGFD